jgi:tRNA-dependent cyclodipeptide synthase
MLSPNRYRARVNACPEWVGYTSCTLGISVGQPYHDGEKFAALVEWAARHFEHIRVDVADTLQRHRLVGEGAPAADAARAARREGDRWVARATPALAACGKPFTIIRWDEWLRHADFPATLGIYTRLAREDHTLGAAIAADIDGFLARRARHGVPIGDTAAVRAASHAYLIEELAAITLQGRAQGSARLYPGPELASFRAIRSGHVAGAPEGIERDYYVHINFERRKAPAPQPAATTSAVPVLKIA